jgi:hypothetical protein
MNDFKKFREVVYLVLEFRKKKQTFAKFEGVMWTFSYLK